jgi:hypothetical protein
LPIAIYSQPSDDRHRDRIAASTESTSLVNDDLEISGLTKKRYSLMLTPTAAIGVDTIAAEFGVSRSELVERLGRGRLGTDGKRTWNLAPGATGRN